MKESGTTDLATVKRTDTAELRRRYDDITHLLKEGYNHKQICEHLNKLGLRIPYAQYRVIMSRLRREKNVTANPALNHKLPMILPEVVGPTHSSVVGLAPTQNPCGLEAGEKKILWDPLSEVKWK